MRRVLYRLFIEARYSGDHVPDAELLRRFVASNDSAAFELVVRRHADAVWATCRRMLKREADADDAFQATFLALIRKASAIRTPCAGGWLHRVAVNAALKLRRTRSVSDGVNMDAIPAAIDEAPDTELAVAVHEELARLSERERLPIVLCDLEGLSHSEAAKSLGWPIGTVSGRLSRARAKLRTRLERRGLTPSATMLPALFAPPQLIPTTLSLTTGAASPAVVSLAEGAIAMMTISSWTWAAAAVVCAGLVGGGVMALQPGSEELLAPVADKHPAPAAKENANPDASEPQPKEKEEKPPANYTAFPELDAAGFNDKKNLPNLFGGKRVAFAPTDDTLRKLQKVRLNQALDNVEEVVYLVSQTTARELSGLGISILTIYEACDRAVVAATDVYPDPKEQRPWFEERVRLAKWLDSLRGKDSKGMDSVKQLTLREARLQAEIALYKLKNPPKAAGGR